MNSKEKENIFSKHYYYNQEVSNYRDYDKYDNDWHWNNFCKIIQTLKIKGKILDIGCAFGYFLKRTDIIFEDLYGIDISSFAIDKAKEVFPKGKYQIVDVDRSELPFPNEYFDLITAFDVLEHTQSLENSLNKIIPKLKKGAYLIISLPVGDTWAGKINRFFDKDVSHISVPTRKQLFDAIEKSGLSVIKKNSVCTTTYFRIPFLPVSYELVLQKQ